MVREIGSHDQEAAVAVSPAGWWSSVALGESGGSDRRHRRVVAPQAFQSGKCVVQQSEAGSLSAGESSAHVRLCAAPHGRWGPARPADHGGSALGTGSRKREKGSPVSEELG